MKHEPLIPSSAPPQDPSLEEKEDPKKITFPNGQEFLSIVRETGEQDLVEAFELALKISERIKAEGGRALLVGGSVRDYFLGKVSKDFDLEVYGIPIERLQEILMGMGEVLEVGKDFGVLKMPIKKGSGMCVDVSLPRRDSKVAEGHRGIKATGDHTMSIEEASKRRDFTINSMAADPLTGEFFDHNGGYNDIQTRTLRVTDPILFRDDPVRVLRGMQFVARFGLSVEPETLTILKDVAPVLEKMSGERIFEEWSKLLLKAEKPSLGLIAGMDWGVIPAFHPTLAALAGTPQEPEWHPEGDVWMHTLMVVDEAAQLIRARKVKEGSALPVMLGALKHDCGKHKTTAIINGRITSLGHEPAGREATLQFLESIGIAAERHQDIRDKVVALVVNHMTPTSLYLQNLNTPVTQSAIRRIATRIHPATIDELILVAEADHRGRGPFPEDAEMDLSPHEYVPGEWLAEMAKEVGVYKSKPKALISGEDLISMGHKPGVLFGQIIRLGDRVRNVEEKIRLLQGETGSVSKEEILDLARDCEDLEGMIIKMKVHAIETVQKARALLREKRKAAKEEPKD